MAVKSFQTKGWTNPATTASFWAAMEEAQRRELARNLIRLREERDWSSERLAQEAGVSSKTISRLENAHVEDPRSATIAKLADAFDVDREKITGPRLSVDEPEGPLEEIRRMLREVLSRLPEPDEDRLAVEAEEEEAARQSERSESERATKTRGPQRQAPQRKRRA